VAQYRDEPGFLDNIGTARTASRSCLIGRFTIALAAKPTSAFFVWLTVASAAASKRPLSATLAT
jgi:hypothetical protein